jgi:hypothetical protein
VKKVGNSMDIDTLKKKMENVGYYPERKLVLETALGIKAMKEDGQVGQGIHAICLSGPPGAGKSFYAKTYKKILAQEIGKKIDFVKYTCNTSTGKSDLYEEINVSEAVAPDADREKIILRGKVLESIDLVNEGKNVILFLDEYDKAREETDTFLLDFLQDGEINTTQRGTATIQEEYLKNLQVIVCKNDHREELSGPLTRRLKFIKLDYMKPDILRKAIDHSLKDYNQSIKDAITLLYTGIYESRDMFERVPACSECMQAIKDAETLMNIGANKSDIVATAIISNMFKNENDVETFNALVQERKRSEFIAWYDEVINAVGSGDKDYIESVKTEMARNFFPEHLKLATQELENKKRELENQIVTMEEKAHEYEKKKNAIEREYEKKKNAIEKEKNNLAKKEEELIKREEETQILRENAEKDANESAQKMLDKKSEDLKKKYEKKQKELEKKEEEINALRENAEKDAINVANEHLEKEKKKIEEELNTKIQEVNRQIQDNNKEMDKKLTDYNYLKAQREELEDSLGEKEEILLAQKNLLEKLLGRKIEESDFDVQESEDEKLEIDNNKSFVMQEAERGEIQKIDTDNTKSAFDYSNGENWIEIGELVLERNKDKKQLIFGKEETKKLGRILTGEKFEKQRTALCDDGIVLYQGISNRIIAVRFIEEENEGYKNLYRFYSNTMVVPLQSFKTIINMIANIIAASGKKIISKEPIEIEFNCLLYSNKKHANHENCRFEKIEDEVFYLKYANKTETIPSAIAKYLNGENGLNLSIKDIKDEDLEMLEKKAYIKHIEYVNKEKMDVIEKIDEISKLEIGEMKVQNER